MCDELNKASKMESKLGNNWPKLCNNLTVLKDNFVLQY